MNVSLGCNGTLTALCGPSQAQAGIVMGVWRSFLDAADSQQLSQQPATMHKRCIEGIWSFVVQTLNDDEAWFLVGHQPSGTFLTSPETPSMPS